MKKALKEKDDRIQELQKTIDEIKKGASDDKDSKIVELNEKMAAKDQQIQTLSNKMEEEFKNQKKKYEKILETIFENVTTYCVTIRKKIDDKEPFEKKGTLDTAFSKLTKLIDKTTGMVKTQQERIAELEGMTKEANGKLEISQKELEEAKKTIVELENKVTSADSSSSEQIEELKTVVQKLEADNKKIVEEKDKIIGEKEKANEELNTQLTTKIQDLEKATTLNE